MSKVTTLTEIVVPTSGKPGWYGGAYTIAFVYSNKGNFILKGFMKEVEELLQKKQLEGLKYYCNFTLWNDGKFRNILKFYKKNCGMSGPSKSDRRGRIKWNEQSRRFRIYQYLQPGETTRKELSFKRLPKTWIPLFDTL